MPKVNSSCPCSGSQAGDRSPVGGPVEMPPLALERLGSTAIPGEFENLVREAIPRVGMSPGSEWAATSTAPGTDTAANPGAGTFSLADLTLDLSRVPHQTEGLRGMRGFRLASLASDFRPLQQMGPADLLTMDGLDDSETSPNEKIMQFGELEMDATFKFVPAKAVDAIFQYVDENINSKLPIGKVTKEGLESALGAITPEFNLNFDCTGSCESFAIKIGQQEPKLYGVAGIDLPVLLEIEAAVLIRPAEVISPCVTEEELDYRRKKEEYDRKVIGHLKATRERADRSAKAEPPGPMPKLPEGKPERPEKEKRSKPGRQVRQDFIIRWDYTIKDPLLGIKYADRLYTQTVTRYSPCCPLAPAAMPIPPVVPPEGEGEDEEEKDKQKEFFLAGWPELGQAVTHDTPYPRLPLGPAPKESSKEGAVIAEDQRKESLIVRLDHVAVSSEKLALTFRAGDITISPTLPGEKTADSPNINAASLTSTGPKVPLEGQ